MTEVGPVQRDEVGEQRYVNLEAWIRQAQRRATFGHDPVSLSMIAEPHLDGEPGPREASHVHLAMQPPEEQVGVELGRIRLAERPSCSPGRESKDDWLEITAGISEQVTTGVVVIDEAGDSELAEPACQERTRKTRVAADQFIETRGPGQEIANDLDRPAVTEDLG